MKKVIGISAFAGGTINHQKLAENLYKAGVIYDLFEMEEDGTLTLHFDDKDLQTVEEVIANNDNTIDEPLSEIEQLGQMITELELMLLEKTG